MSVGWLNNGGGCRLFFEVLLFFLCVCVNNREAVAANVVPTLVSYSTNESE